MVTSADGGATFTEQHLSGAFNLYNAADAEGLFLGDYQGLVNTGTGGAFLPFYAQPPPATSAGSAVSTNTFISYPPAVAAAAALPFAVPPASAPAALSAEAHERVMGRIRLVQAQRLRGR